MASAETVSAVRTRVRFRSGEAECAGVFIRPDTTEDVPCLLLAHGFGGLKEAGLVARAEAFAGKGIATLAFDYRYFGESGGEPRQLLSVKRQLEDWRAAIAHARMLSGVDPERIGLWGTSYSGGHVMALAADDHSIGAVISHAPHVDGVKTLTNLTPLHNLKLTLAALRDALAGLLGLGSKPIAIVGPPGSLAAMSTPDAEPGYSALYDEGFEWKNEFLPRDVLLLPLNSPGKRTGEIKCPILVQVCSDDAITPPGPAIEAATRAPRGELIVYAGLGHFDIYFGEPFEQAFADQLEFLERHLVRPA